MGNEIVVDRERFQKPSDLLQAGHQQKDPIVPVLSLLDKDCIKLSDLYYDLVVHGIMRDRDCPTSSDEFILSYNEIKNDLEENISLITAKQSRKEKELFTMKNQENALRKREEQELVGLRSNLQNQENERYRLLEEKRRIEAQLNDVNDNLRKTDMFIEGTERDIARIANSYKPEQDHLHDRMQDHQFEIAGFAQELSVYSALLSIGNESYNLLDSWSHSMNKHDNNHQSELENNYINHLASYLGKLCGAKLMVTYRVEQLKQYIDALKRTNETTNKHYAQSFNIDDQLEQYKNHITIDESTSMSITSDILMNIEKAQKAISAELFEKFIHHLQQHQTGKIIDLSKYINMNKMNNMLMNSDNNIIRQRPLRSRHTRQSIATQTNLQRQQQQQQQLRNNGHSMKQTQVQQQQQQQQSVSPNSQQQRSKPPLISSQQQRSPNGVGVGRGRMRGTRPPRSARNIYQYQQ